jgi:DNA-binding Lrp family transcriptional regulator
LLRRAGRPLSNNEVAALSGVVKSEASKRVQKAIEAGIVSKRRVGKEVAIALN